MLTKGRESARVLRRASILRQLDSGQKAAQVAASVGVAAKTVRAVARRYEEEGLESALYEKARPGKQRALDVGQSQRIIAMVCGPPPQGRARWSVRLIATEAVKRKLAPQVGRETIRILLQSHEMTAPKIAPTISGREDRCTAASENQPERAAHFSDGAFE